MPLIDELMNLSTKSLEEISKIKGAREKMGIAHQLWAASILGTPFPDSLDYTNDHPKKTESNREIMARMVSLGFVKKLGKSDAIKRELYQPNPPAKELYTKLSDAGYYKNIKHCDF